MVRQMRTVKAIITLEYRERIEHMIREIGNNEMDVNDKNDKF